MSPEAPQAPATDAPQGPAPDSPAACAVEANAAARQRWLDEAAIHERAGDYAWMAGLAPGRRVLEIGCGAGYGSAALCAAGKALLVIEPDARCRSLARERCAAGGASAEFIAAPIETLDAAGHAAIAAFAPDCVVCWLIGGDEASLARVALAALPAERVRLYREAVHRRVAELAAGLPTVSAVHLVDRSAFAWKIRDTARDTLLAYHAATTFAGLPFAAQRADALYRKLDAGRWSPELARRGGMVPVLGSLLAQRTGNMRG